MVRNSEGVLASGYLHTSDQRLKKNIRPMDGLDFIRKLAGVRFQWKSNGQEDVGFLAQEVEKVAPELVVTGADGIKSVKYDVIVSPLVEAVKELDLRCEASDRQVANLQHEVTDLRKRVEGLEKALETLMRSAANP